MSTPPTSTGSSVSPAVAAVSLKLPPFWPADPEVWFAQVEAQFTTRSISSQKTRFDYVVSSLSPEFATEVRDLLLKPPSENQYDVLKAQLVKRTAASEQRKLQQLISGEELSDRKPTQLLRRMQQLLGDKLGSTTDTNSFLHELFLQRLPASVRMVLASADPSTTIDKLAEMADKVMEVAAPTAPNVSAVSHVTADHLELKQLREDVARLTELVQTLSIWSRPTAPAAFLVLVTALQHQHLNTMTLSCAGITPNLEKLRRSVRNRAVGETPRPHTSGDKCCRPQSQLPLLCH